MRARLLLDEGEGAASQRSTLDAQQLRLEQGLVKLRSSAEQVAEMQVQAPGRIGFGCVATVIAA